MAERAKNRHLSSIQLSILARLQAGERLQFDVVRGRYHFRGEGRADEAPARSALALRRRGLLAVSPYGACVPGAAPAVKNCHGCRHLKYDDDGDSDGHIGPDTGFSCAKRVAASVQSQRSMLLKLQDVTYRMRAKRCHEIHVATGEA